MPNTNKEKRLAVQSRTTNQYLEEKRKEKKKEGERGRERERERELELELENFILQGL